MSLVHDLSRERGQKKRFMEEVITRMIAGTLHIPNLRMKSLLVRIQFPGERCTRSSELQLPLLRANDLDTEIPIDSRKPI